MQEKLAKLEADNADLRQQIAVAEEKQKSAVETVRAEYEKKISDAKEAGLQNGMRAAERMFALIRGGGSPAMGVSSPASAFTPSI